FNRILTELELNGMKGASIPRVRNLICKPLHKMTDKANGQFKLTEDAAEKLQNMLEGKEAGNLTAAGNDAKKKLDDLVDQLYRVLEQMQKIIDKDALVRIAVEMEEKQRKQTDELAKLEEELKKILFDELKGKKRE